MIFQTTRSKPHEKINSKSQSVSFNQAIDIGFTKYAEFTGHASRSEFWWWTLFTFLVAIALGMLNNIAINSDLGLGSLLSSFWSLAVFLPSLAIGVRRLRDAGYGWGHLFWFLIPLAGFIILIILWLQPSKK